MPKGALRWGLRNRIAMVREARGFTQRELAARLGVPKSTLAHWEMDEGRPSGAVIGKMAQILCVRPGHLFPLDFV